MRPCILLLPLLVVLAGCKPEDTPAALRMVHTLVVETKRINQDRQAIGEGTEARQSRQFSGVPVLANA